MSSDKTIVVDDAGPVSREAWESAGTDFNAGTKAHRKPSLKQRAARKSSQHDDNAPLTRPTS